MASVATASTAPFPTPAAAPHRAVQIPISLALGAGMGYLQHWIFRLLERIEVLETGGVPIQPLPYVLAGVAWMAIFETGRLVYDGAVWSLGERIDEDEEVSGFDALRQKSWKVITVLEGVDQRVDQVFSNFCGIRTKQEIKKQKDALEVSLGIEKQLEEKIEQLREKLEKFEEELEDDEGKLAAEKRKLDQEFVKKQQELEDCVLVHLSLSRIEVLREAFLQQVLETFKGAIPQELGVYAVKSLGYNLVGVEFMFALHVINFVGGVLRKSNAHHKKIITYCKKFGPAKAATGKGGAISAASTPATKTEVKTPKPSTSTPKKTSPTVKKKISPEKVEERVERFMAAREARIAAAAKAAAEEKAEKGSVEVKVE